MVLNIGCGVGRVDKYLAPRVRELHAIDVSGYGGEGDRQAEVDVAARRAPS